MRLLIAALLFLPTVSVAQNITFDDGPWITIPAGMAYPEYTSPEEEIRAMADLDGDPSVTTLEELRMIATLTQILGVLPVEY
jgi:hypothetical protein